MIRLNNHMTTTTTSAAPALQRLSTASLRRAIERAGGTMEEDHGYRDMRTFQAVAPNGMRWRGNGCMHVRIEWERTNEPSLYNLETFRMVLGIVRAGLEPIPENEKYIYDESE